MNRNGKARTDKLGFCYDSERKTCFICGKSNHLAHDFKSVIKSKFSDNTALELNLVVRSVNVCRMGG